MFGRVMFMIFKYYNSVLSYMYSYIVKKFSYFYLIILARVLILFLMYRFPYCYRPFFFIFFLVVVVFRSFTSLFCGRVFFSLRGFFRGFVPVGTPMYICPLVCIAETISYFIRPIVLILRPFINISLGCVGSIVLCGLCYNKLVWLFVLFIVFFYEVFVACVHWFIVTRILDFSIDH